MSVILKDHRFRFSNRQPIADGDAESFLDALISEEDEDLLAAVFNAWHAKGIDADEIYAFATIMRSRVIRINSVHETFIDVVGTGGSGSKTFNVSTAASFIAAGTGVPVAKHGNRAATSRTGSADVLEALGITAAMDAESAERCLNEIGICFMFAPNFHRLSPTLGKVRRGLGFPTIFNCVGPLCNPAAAPHQLIGVWDEKMVEKMATALARLGTERSWIAHGMDGLDEISMSTATRIAEVCRGRVRYFEISPEDAGLSPVRDIAKVDSSAESAKIIKGVLSPGGPAAAARDIAAINAAAALVVAGFEAELPAAYARAIDSIVSGSAIEKLNQLASSSSR